MSSFDRDALLRLLPEKRVGAVQSIEPITLGLSGAGVFALQTSHGARVLRVQGAERDEGAFAQQLLVLRRAADAGVAPAVLHVDEASRAVVSERVMGVPMAAVLGDPTQRQAVFGSVIDRLRVLHGLDTSGIGERDPMTYARAIWQAGRVRAGFPPWAMDLSSVFDEIAVVLARDPRRVVSHNDLNPVNVMWDGARAWLVDWEVAALGHPHYDLAVFALFLRLDEEVAFALAGLHDGAPIDAPAQENFRALRRLSGLLCGLTFLSLVDDLNVRFAASLADAPSLGDCYAAMRTGQLDMQSAVGRASMGLALLGLGVAG